MQYDKEYDDIRPFTNREVEEALPFAASTPYLQQVVRYADPGMSDQEITARACTCHSAEDFVGNVLYRPVTLLLEKTTDGVSYNGLDELEKRQPYVFLSNHRDIVMDSVILNYGLFARGMPLAQSAIGNNLVPNEGLLTVARINKNFVVRRDLSPRDTLVFSQRLSRYIRHVIHDIKDSVWIAHREGRAKDGDDRTNAGVIKMLAMASQGADMIDHLKSLHIVPMAISYEWDATDALKLRELLARAQGLKYVKAKDEDLNSIITGIAGRKGRVSISVGRPLDEELEGLRGLDNDVRRIRAVCEVVDQAIHRLYELFPTNYAAFDLLEGTDKYAGRYSAAEKEAFVQRLRATVEAVGGGEEARNIMLRMYANPVINKNEAIQKNEQE